MFMWVCERKTQYQLCVTSIAFILFLTFPFDWNRVKQKLLAKAFLAVAGRKLPWNEHAATNSEDTDTHAGFVLPSTLEPKTIREFFCILHMSIDPAFAKREIQVSLSLS